jgi:TusE/DsrC/DsvC family sulfur relay protein
MEQLFDINNNQEPFTREHLAVIALLKDFYQEFSINPSTKALINYAKQKNSALNLDGLMFAQLFPQGIEQACLLAGLPKSPRCL